MVRKSLMCAAVARNFEKFASEMANFAKMGLQRHDSWPLASWWLICVALYAMSLCFFFDLNFKFDFDQGWISWCPTITDLWPRTWRIGWHGKPRNAGRFLVAFAELLQMFQHHFALLYMVLGHHLVPNGWSNTRNGLLPTRFLEFMFFFLSPLHVLYKWCLLLPILFSHAKAGRSRTAKGSLQPHAPKGSAWLQIRERWMYPSCTIGRCQSTWFYMVHGQHN